MNELQILQMQISRAKEEIRCCNDLNQIYGLALTEADITELVELRGQALRSTGRVEFGGGILPKLIRAFCKSPYVDPYNYAATLGYLQDAFYYFKMSLRIGSPMMTSSSSWKRYSTDKHMALLRY